MNFLFTLWFPGKRSKYSRGELDCKLLIVKKYLAFIFAGKEDISKMNFMFVFLPATFAQVSRQSQQHHFWRIRKDASPFGTKTLVNTCWLWFQIASVWELITGPKLRTSFNLIFKLLSEWTRVSRFVFFKILNFTCLWNWWILDFSCIFCINVFIKHTLKIILVYHPLPWGQFLILNFLPGVIRS